MLRNKHTQDTLDPISTILGRGIIRGCARETLTVRFYGTYERAAEFFSDGVMLEEVQPGVPEPVVTELSRFAVLGDIIDHRTGCITVTLGAVTPEEAEQEALRGELGRVRLITGGADITPENAPLFRRVIEAGARTLPDRSALENPTLFPLWRDYDSFTEDDVADGLRVRGDDGILYRVIAPHTRLDAWPPSASATLFEVVSMGHSGSADDPIPAEVGLRYEKDKHYLEGDKIYLCIREDSGGGTVLYYLPSALVGNYFNEIPRPERAE